MVLSFPFSPLFSFRATLAAGDPGGFPALSPGQESTRQFSLGQSAALFGSRSTSGQKPASLHFPRRRNPRARTTGAFPRPVALAQLQSRGAEAAATPASVCRPDIPPPRCRSVSLGAPPPPPPRSSTAAASLLVRRRHLHRRCHPSQRSVHLICFVAVVSRSARV